LRKKKWRPCSFRRINVDEISGQVSRIRRIQPMREPRLCVPAHCGIEKLEADVNWNFRPASRTVVTEAAC
jgi:hypothetical protein